MDAIGKQLAKQIVAQPWRAVGIAALAGLWLGHDSPRRGILLGVVRMLVMHELRTFVDLLPGQPGTGAVIPRPQAFAS